MVALWFLQSISRRWESWSETLSNVETKRDWLSTQMKSIALARARRRIIWSSLSGHECQVPTENYQPSVEASYFSVVTLLGSSWPGHPI